MPDNRRSFLASSARDPINDALYEAGVITDILVKLGNADISSSEPVLCGTQVVFLVELLEERHDVIREAVKMPRLAG